jgi:hypothetical protein
MMVRAMRSRDMPVPQRYIKQLLVHMTAAAPRLSAGISRRVIVGGVARTLRGRRR